MPHQWFIDPIAQIDLDRAMLWSGSR